MPSYLDWPTPYTLRGFGVLKSRPRALRHYAGVDVLPQQNRYLRYQILDVTWVAGDYGTTKLGVLIPGPNAPRNAHGNLPRNYVKRMLQQPGVAWIRIHQGQYVGPIRHRGRKIELLAIKIPEAHYRPRLRFYDLVEEALAGAGAENVVGWRLGTLSSQHLTSQIRERSQALQMVKCRDWGTQ